jgi:hypothetical protein
MFTMHREVTISPDAPMPKGYAFLPKGVVFKTFHCRKLTRESGRTLYVVTNNKNTLGLQAPKAIIAQVHSKAKDTLATRRAAVQKKDAADIDKATGELRDQFPKMPKIDKNLILCHGFRKHSGRVGRNGSMALAKKVTLAVIAHIRHRHTDYDTLLRHGQAREATRKAIWKQIDNTMREWGCTDGNPKVVYHQLTAC